MNDFSKIVKLKETREKLDEIAGRCCNILNDEVVQTLLSPDQVTGVRTIVASVTRVRNEITTEISRLLLVDPISRARKFEAEAVQLRETVAQLRKLCGDADYEIFRMAGPHKHPEGVTCSVCKVRNRLCAESSTGTPDPI